MLLQSFHHQLLRLQNKSLVVGSINVRNWDLLPSAVPEWLMGALNVPGHKCRNVGCCLGIVGHIVDELLPGRCYGTVAILLEFEFQLQRLYVCLA